MKVRPASMVDSALGVSIRLEILIGASVAQSRWVQYASCSAYVVSVIRVIHLLGADEAVEPGHHHPGREAVLPRAAASPFMPIAIIASRPSVARSSGVLIVIPSTSVLTGSGRRRAADAGPVEQVGEPDAEPAGAADVGAADVVGDAGERDVALDQGHREQVVEA